MGQMDERKWKFGFNFSSLMVYWSILLLTVYGWHCGRWGGLIGVLAGAVLIYGVLADNKEREQIRKNLTWRID